MNIEDLTSVELRRVLRLAFAFEAPEDWDQPRILAELSARVDAREQEPDEAKALPEELRRKRQNGRGARCRTCGSTDTWVERSMLASAYPAVIAVRRRYHKCGHCGRTFRTEGPL